MDIFFAFILFVISLPVFLCIFILLLVINRGEVFFLQQRPGKDEKLFTIIKFKTMHDAVTEHKKLLPDEERVTFIGSILRNTHLDELPQFLNVLKGDMSIIGPRPLLTEYLQLYNPSQRRRHFVKPGITGWAQVWGHKAQSWGDVFLMDAWYVEHISLQLDVRVFFLTVKKIFVKIFVHTEKTQFEKFTGNN
jgi:lipopolysaccharide/colanic/teichoic acid biosynthesis glycosyltransferase